MSTLDQPLSDTIITVERSLFKAIDRQLVAKGYFPDLTLLPNTTQGVADYKTQLTQIAQEKGFAIEVFGVGSSQAKWLKKIPRIVITAQNVLPGDLGGDPQVYHEIDPDNPDKYQSKVRPPQTKSYFYSVSLAWNSAEQHRVMAGILGLSLPTRGYIDLHGYPESKVFIRQAGFSRSPNTTEGISEEHYLYEVPDLFEVNSTIVRSGISKILEITNDFAIGDSEESEQGPIDIITN